MEDNNQSQNNNLTKEDIKELLDQQTEKVEKLFDERTNVILNAVSEKITSSEIRLEKRIADSEFRLNQKFDRLITTLDGFLKRMTDMEDEFEMMKADINRMKRIFKEKLQVEV
ncbi:hypothetical protein KKA24_03240 [Patescibacteria group bacterium]|nr:hypothetical protein [Patescibacteria group bacterium]